MSETERRAAERAAERVHVTRSRAKPGGTAAERRRHRPLPPRPQAAVAEGAGAGRARPTGG